MSPPPPPRSATRSSVGAELKGEGGRVRRFGFGGRGVLAIFGVLPGRVGRRGEKGRRRTSSTRGAASLGEAPTCHIREEALARLGLVGEGSTSLAVGRGLLVSLSGGAWRWAPPHRTTDAHRRRAARERRTHLKAELEGQRTKGALLNAAMMRMHATRARCKGCA
eukprot:6046231-Prymnesium_polylepis.1